MLYRNLTRDDLFIVDSASRHSSVQGESDSEPEVLVTLSSTLRSILSSDSGDDNFIPSGRDVDDDDDDAFDSAAERPVFLTAKGPVSATIGKALLTPLHARHLFWL